MMINQLQEKNPNYNILSIQNSKFSRYGKVLNPNDFQDVFNYLENHTIIPKTENNYVAHDPNLEVNIKSHTAISNVFGEMTVQYGYVNGNNSKLNALEYHKSSEINVALTPLVLMLSRVEDIRNSQFSSDQVEIFYVPKRSVIEIFPQTLHFSPCKVSDEGFKCGVLLPFGTNMKFILNKQNHQEEDILLFKTNKWILVHQEHKKFIDLGAHVGIVGNNIEIKY